MENSNQNNANILITGASGLSGSMIVDELLRENIPVSILVRNAEKARHLKGNPNVKIFEGNLLKPETYRNALVGIDRALIISSAFERMQETQQTFIDAAKEAGVPHVIKYSGADSGIGFISHKFIAQKEHEDIEDYLINSGLRWTIIRPSQFMQMYLPKAPTGVDLSTSSLTLPIKNGKLSPVAIEDVAKVCVQLLTQDGHENKIYEMTGPDAINMEEACDIISTATGRKIRYNNIELSDYETELLNKGIPKERSTILMQISKQRMKCIDSHVKLETHKLFGVRPTNFAEFIYKNLSNFSKQNEIKELVGQ